MPKNPPPKKQQIKIHAPKTHQFGRNVRVGEEMRQGIADIFTRGELHDPELEKIRITVSEVRVSSDLRNATAFIAPLGGLSPSEMKYLLKQLKESAPKIRNLLTSKMRLRVIPRIQFVEDGSFAVAGRINQLLHDPRVKQDIIPKNE
jgi:ribosome-binding factor A